MRNIRRNNPFTVVALGNPHSDEGVSWAVQAPDGRVLAGRYASARIAELAAFGLHHADQRVRRGARDCTRELRPVQGPLFRDEGGYC